jgi:hypothetical protein
VVASSCHVSKSFVPVHFDPSFHFGSADRAGGVVPGVGPGSPDVPGEGVPELELADDGGGVPSSSGEFDRDGVGDDDAPEHAARSATHVTSAAHARTMEERTTSP